MFGTKLLSYCTQNKIELYYLNIKLLCILLPLVLFVFLMSNNIQPIIAIYVSVLFLFSFINLPIWPKVSHWCLIVFLTTIIISKQFFKSVHLKFITILIGVIICSYIRPEFYLAFILIAAYSCIHFVLYRNQYDIKKSIVYFLSIFVLYLLIRSIGNPTKTGVNGRLLITFGQHFALNYCKWNNINDKPFWIDWVFYLQDNFINKPTSEIVLTIAHHFISNIANYITSIFKICISFIIPIFHKKISYHSIIIVFITIIILIKNSSTLQQTKQHIKTGFLSNSSLLKILFIWCIPTFISSFIAYPRDHYLLLQIPFYLMILILFIQSIIKITSNFTVFIIISILLLLAKPSSINFDYFDLLRKEKSRCNAVTINYLMEKYPTNEIKIFDFEGDINTMLPANFTANNIDFFTKGSTIVSRYFDSAKMDIIYVTPTLLNTRFTKDDTLLKNWITTPERYGFQKIKTGNFEPYLLSRIK
jgi:hypothetical protein